MNPCVLYAPMIGTREGELAAADQAALADHLSTCTACQARLADQQALQGMLGEALLHEASGRDFSTFVDEVMERVGHESGARYLKFGAARTWWHRPRFVAASLLAPALVALGLIVYLHIQGPAFEMGEVDVTSEDYAPMVLQTDDGPLVVLGEEDPQKT